jgi:hypothetical protein
MSIDDLISIVSPPSSPLNIGGAADDTRIEEAIGIQLPADYWAFARRYGSGRFLTSNFEIVVYNPFSEGYQRGVELDCKMLETVPDLGYDVYPARPGLFPWGGDVNGNSLFWYTKGLPHEWRIVLCPETGLKSDFEEFGVAMTLFLADVFRGSIRCKAWDEAMAFVDDDVPRFVPG